MSVAADVTDLLLHDQQFTWAMITGSVLISLGFALVTVSHLLDKRQE